jgi:preprotein translocase subunit SecG
MYTALAIVHIMVALGLILVVLLQSGKGADIGAAFGGGSSQTVFGARGGATFLSRATTVLAVMFMVLSIGLTLVSSSRGRAVALPEELPKSAPAPSAPAAPGAQAPAPPAAPAPAK